MTNLEHNLRAVQERIKNAVERTGRDPNSVTLVAITKTFPVETILTAYELGLRHFGENRVEEASEKIPQVERQLATNERSTYRTNKLIWHMVGHLQQRKAKDAVALFDLVHSVDSAALAVRLDHRAAALDKMLPVFLEVNVSGEASKFGFAPEPRENFFEAARAIFSLRHLNAQGLMTIAPIVVNSDDARPYFRALRELRDELHARFPDHALPHLSMGMTDDFEAAIAEGATLVRIGRAIFGERKTST